MTEVNLTADQMQGIAYALSFGVNWLAFIAGLLVFS